MKKDFINTSQDSGNKNQVVTLEADPNDTFGSREVNLTVRSSKGVARNVRAVQEGIPYVTNINAVLYSNTASMINMYFLGFEIVQESGYTYPLYKYGFTKNDISGSITFDIGITILKSLCSKISNIKLEDSRMMSVTSNNPNYICGHTYLAPAPFGSFNKGFQKVMMGTRILAAYQIELL